MKMPARKEDPSEAEGDEDWVAYMDSQGWKKDKLREVRLWPITISTMFLSLIRHKSMKLITLCFVVMLIFKLISYSVFSFSHLMILSLCEFFYILCFVLVILYSHFMWVKVKDLPNSEWESGKNWSRERIGEETEVQHGHPCQLTRTVLHGLKKLEVQHGKP